MKCRPQFTLLAVLAANHLQKSHNAPPPKPPPPRKMPFSRSLFRRRLVAGCSNMDSTSASGTSYGSGGNQIGSVTSSNLRLRQASFGDSPSTGVAGSLATQASDVTGSVSVNIAQPQGTVPLSTYGTPVSHNSVALATGGNRMPLVGPSEFSCISQSAVIARHPHFQNLQAATAANMANG
ncbi:unnamed protein product, partial [Protopolystoma xenopodis]